MHNAFHSKSSPQARQDDIDHTLTVVIVALVGGEALDRCISGVRGLGYPFIVVDEQAIRNSEGQEVRSGPGKLSVPDRRRLGAEQVTTEFVAFIEDTAVPCATWGDAILSALSDPAVAAVGGPVSVSAELGARFRALGLCEYGRFQAHRFSTLAADSPIRGKRLTVCALPGVNFAFKREILLTSLPNPDDGLVDNEVFARLRNEGYKLALEPTMSVVYRESHSKGAQLTTRYHHGRIYASGVVRGRPLLPKLMSALKSFALPIVLSIRTLQEARRVFRRDPATVAWIFAQHLSWSVGEFVGSISGPSRRGLEHWT